jgi:hypothetical protein
VAKKSTIPTKKSPGFAIASSIMLIAPCYLNNPAKHQKYRNNLNDLCMRGMLLNYGAAGK